MKNWRRVFKYFGWGMFGCVFIIPIALLSWRVASNGDNFVLANYQSYIDIAGGEEGDESYPSVKKYLKDKYNISYDYYETAESARNLLVKNTADIVNTTTYELVNWVKSLQKIVHKLDWSRFGIEGINDAKDALNLFTPEVQVALTAYDINGDGKIDDDDNLLNYGIPYFLQDYIFAYRGEKINDFHQPNITWKKFFDLMSTNSGIKARFQSHKTPNLFAVEDPRTFLTIANNIYKEKNNLPEIPREQKFSMNHIVEQYQDLANYFNNISYRPITFNPDANVTLNKIARWEVEGGFCYNGDALYAAYGGDDQLAPKKDTLHIVKPIDTIAALDMFVINSHLEGYMLDKAYDIMGELLLGTYTDNNGEKVTIKSPNWEPKKSWTYRNFNFVNYTTPLDKLYNFVYDNYFKEDNGQQDETKRNIFKVNIQGPQNYEEPIDNLEKSNIQFSWIGFLASLT